MIAGRNTPVQEFIREQVAGAARCLWLKRGKRAQYELMHSAGGHIVYLQGTSYLGRRWMSPVDFVYMCRIRERIADAALYLAIECGFSRAYLCALQPRAVIQAAWEQGMPSREQRQNMTRSAAKLRPGVYEEHPGCREQRGSSWVAAPGPVELGCGTWEAHIAGAVPGSPIRLDDEVIGYVGGENPVADAAQWLYHNRGARLQTLAYKTPHVIVRMYELCKAADDAKAVNESEKKYSLSDLQAAYAIGHYDGCNAPNAHINEAKRDAALKEI